MNEDFPKEIQDRRHLLQPVMQRARAKDLQAFINVDTLFMDGQKYTTDDLGKLPADLDPHKKQVSIC